MSISRQSESGVAANRGRLLYVVGPSGAGKDTLLEFARNHLSLDLAPRVRFAQRCITRPAGAQGEQHQAVTAEQFALMTAAVRFAMAWRANGNDYGIGAEIRDWLGEGHTVVVNGSRGYLAQALRDFPHLEVICVTVNLETLRRRLEDRGRDSLQEIEGRLARAREFALPDGTAKLEIRNDQSVQAGGEALLEAIAGR